MPNAPAPRPERDFCSNCGFPVRGGRCEACGAPHRADPHSATEQSLLTQSQIRPYTSPAEADSAGLERAIEAHRVKDMPRFVDLVLAAETGGTQRSAAAPEGTGWVAAVHGSLVFVTLRSGADEVVLEAPIARLSGRTRLAAMRLALELSGRNAATSRVCIRGELLLLRFTARVSLLTPPALRYYLREVAHLAARYAGLMTMGLDAHAAIPDDQRAAAGFDVLGRAKKIQLGTGGSIRRSIPPPVPSKPVADGGARPRGTTDPSSQAIAPGVRMPSVPAPNGGVVPRVPKAPLPPSGLGRQGAEASSDAIPAVLTPMYSAPRAPEVRVELDERFKPSRTAETGTLPHPMAEGGSRRPPPPDPRAEIELEPASRRGTPTPSVPPSPAEPQLSPSDRLCMLLRHAQSLVSLSLEERPATMAWLVRSTVFRAIYDFKDVLPDAVAHLYRCTGIGQQGAPSNAPRSISGQIQGAEPALVVMERVIVARANMQKEKPLAIEPMVSAAQAKEHVARYLSELDRAPGDPAMRHFLALGALTELLVRTKLPPQTDQRLRDIVTHAQREGPKTQAIDLMMTALQRINA